MSAAALAAAEIEVDPAPVVIFMGVSGSGKTTLGEALAARHGFRFLDADDFHPTENVAKMRSGVPLDDADRAPWLERLSELLAAATAPTVLACSALKARYRTRLAAGCDPALFVHLAGSRGTIGARLSARSDHYMPPSLLQSQMEALEAPGEEEGALTLDCDQPVESLCAAVMSALANRRRASQPAAPALA
ncbi:gluconokinase [Aureimonas ureilytica]|uniref:gluconokinase n=1 Tax=Aureimonas ureilytica TaxID=401562 RepID=UPI0003601F15|nr:gluconokinase [Aureimonas ureilytica]